METVLVSLLWQIPLGFAVGTVGTLIGAGGGFILVPILLLIFPSASTESITGISLTVVFFNALSGSLAYSRMKRIDYKSGLLFAAAAVPGSLLGAWTTKFLSRSLFDGVFGTVLILLALYLGYRTLRAARQEAAGEAPAGRTTFLRVFRTLVDWESISYMFSYNPLIGVLVSVLIGFLSSLLGIGGGIFHVPLLATALHFPVHIATATSHFVLAVMTFAGTFVHFWSGEYARSWGLILGLGVGVVAGAQFGARLSNRINGVLIIRLLAVILVLVGIRLVVAAF